MTGCFTGRNLSTLPVEPKLGKMLIFGAIFNCLDPIMTVVAGLSARDPFLMPFDKKDVRFIPCAPCEILMIFYVLVCISVLILFTSLHACMMSYEYSRLDIPNLKLFLWKSVFDWMLSLGSFSFTFLLDLIVNCNLRV